MLSSLNLLSKYQSSIMVVQCFSLPSKLHFHTPANDQPKNFCFFSLFPHLLEVKVGLSTGMWTAELKCARLHINSHSQLDI